MTTAKTGTALTPRMQAAVERAKARKSHAVATDAPEEARAQAIARILYPGICGNYYHARVWAERIIAADPATQRILDLEEKVRALTMVSENAKALLKDALEREEKLLEVMRVVRPLVKYACVKAAGSEEEAIRTTWLGHLDAALLPKAGDQ